MRNETISTLMKVLALLQFLVLLVSTYLIRRNMKRERKRTAEYNARYEELLKSLFLLQAETETVKESYEQSVYEYDTALKELSIRINGNTFRH